MSALIPGKLAPLAPGVWRVLALNPGMMTGPGTNSYLIGRDRLVLLDPGPADSRHVDNLLAAAEEIGAPIERVLVTHTHRDHSPAAHQVAERLRVTMTGPQAPDDGLQDERWQPDEPVVDGTRIDAGGLTLRAIATPGHVDNHFCYLLESERMLFSGDHLIHGSTVVIAPPSGSMSAYIASLYRLLDESIDLMAPGHGELIRDPEDYVRHTIAHREKRERKVLEALRAADAPVTASTLVGEVYRDVPAFLHGVATLSLEAHLIKLGEEGLAEAVGSGWQPG